jgi:hypothetical protein
MSDAGSGTVFLASNLQRVQRPAGLFRLLALTNSPYDGEALAASRMTNKLMKRTGASWVDLFWRAGH